LKTPVYSHLNSFSQITVFGGENLQIAFSAAGNQPITIQAAGYPFGEPGRMAYLDADDQFKVVEATNAEKGPFMPLAQGMLPENQSLEITLLSNDQAQCTIALDDWAAQASTQLSPTAGWGFPENSIEFRLTNDRYENESYANIFISLASTSTGRGYESVGHAAGTYRNRIRILPTE
ncbi:MAG: hypothetical protein AAF902_06225, partial [Chloroflexota bacterium]